MLNILKFRFGMDFIILTFALFAITQKDIGDFIKDWFPPMLLFYIYEALRGRAYTIAKLFHISPIVEPLIWIERKIFFFLDEVPSVKLQYSLHPDKDIYMWYDSILFFFYVMFFWYWLFVGFLIWLRKRELFKPYIYGLLIFSFFDTLIYIFFPSAPPWWASDNGYLPPISRILWTNDYLPSSTISVLSTYERNDFAAFPSHHFAWPFFASLFLVKMYGWKGVPSLLIPGLIAFATWYGAEHYVIDSFAGLIVAGTTFIIVTKCNWDRINLKNLLKKILRRFLVHRKIIK